MLLTHDSGEVLANGEEYNRIINDIVNRVLIGYTVESIQIQPGEDTTLAVQIAWPTAICAMLRLSWKISSSAFPLTPWTGRTAR